MTQQPGDNWSAFYRAVEGRPLRPLFVQFMAAHEADALNSTEQQAVDLGCGDGKETLALLAQGWRVLAIDSEQEAIERLRASAPPENLDRLETDVMPFEAITALPAAHLVYAGFSLPFCAPDSFDALWGHIVAALPVGSYFVGQLFGERDAWAGNAAMTFHTAEAVQTMLRGFEVEHLEEVEQDGPTATQGIKHWHIFHIIARKHA